MSKQLIAIFVLTVMLLVLPLSASATQYVVGKDDNAWSGNL